MPTAACTKLATRYIRRQLFPEQDGPWERVPLAGVVLSERGIGWTSSGDDRSGTLCVRRLDKKDIDLTLAKEHADALLTVEASSG